MTHVWRAAFWTGFWVFGSMAAFVASLVGVPSLVRNWPIWAYVSPPDASRAWMRM